MSKVSSVTLRVWSGTCRGTGKPTWRLGFCDRDKHKDVCPQSWEANFEKKMHAVYVASTLMSGTDKYGDVIEVWHRDSDGNLLHIEPFNAKEIKYEDIK